MFGDISGDAPAVVVAGEPHIPPFASAEGRAAAGECMPDADGFNEVKDAVWELRRCSPDDVTAAAAEGRAAAGEGMPDGFSEVKDAVWELRRCSPDDVIAAAARCIASFELRLSSLKRRSNSDKMGVSP